MHGDTSDSDIGSVSDRDTSRQARVLRPQTATSDRPRSQCASVCPALPRRSEFDPDGARLHSGLTQRVQGLRIEAVLPKSGPVAQLGARFHGMEEVIGSIPIRSTNYFKHLEGPPFRDFVAFLSQIPKPHHELASQALPKPQS